MNIFQRWKHMRKIKKENKQKDNPDVRGVTSEEIDDNELARLKEKYVKKQGENNE
jgi:hypothetical protein